MIGIVAHTARAEQAQQLMETVGAAYTSIDNGTLGCERNHLQTWQWLADHTHNDWAVILEDDAQPIPNFTHHLNQALQHAPSPIVSLYRGHYVNNPAAERAGQAATHKATTDNASWVTSRLMLHAVAFAVTTELLPTLITHINGLSGNLPIDEAVTHFTVRNKLVVAYTHGSLVNHADTPTVITRHRDKLPRPPGRVAYHLGPPTEWTDKAVTL